MLKGLVTAIALAAGLAAAPAAAVTYDAFGSFTGTNTGGAFTYGSYDGTTFTPFNDAPGCASLISDVICTSNGFLPAAFKSTSGAHNSGTVIVPGNALILHPGPDAGQDAAIFFTAPTSGFYSLTLQGFVADVNPSGVNLIGVNPGFFNVPLATLDSNNLSFSFSNPSFFLTAGDLVGFSVNFAGVYFNDSTGVNFTFTTVPEPATWGLMIVGFGLVGVGLRRRAALAA